MVQHGISIMKIQCVAYILNSLNDDWHHIQATMLTSLMSRVMAAAWGLTRLGASAITRALTHGAHMVSSQKGRLQEWLA